MSIVNTIFQASRGHNSLSGHCPQPFKGPEISCHWGFKSK